MVSGQTDDQSSPAKKKRTASPARVLKDSILVCLICYNYQAMFDLFTGLSSHHQNSQDSWENDPGHHQVPNWSLTPQKLQVGRFNFYGGFYICKLLNIYDLSTLTDKFFLLFLNKVSQLHQGCIYLTKKYD